MSNENIEYPRCYTVMSYVVTPEISYRDFMVRDYDDGDCAIRKAAENNGYVPEASNDAAIGIIGGADGPTVIMLGGTDSEGTVRTACSNLRFAQKEKIRWVIEFSVKDLPDIEIEGI